MAYDWLAVILQTKLEALALNFRFLNMASFSNLDDDDHAIVLDGDEDQEIHSVTNTQHAAGKVRVVPANVEAVATEVYIPQMIQVYFPRTIPGVPVFFPDFFPGSTDTLHLRL